MSPEIFAPGIISAEGTQGYPSCSGDGKRFYFNDRRRGGWMVTISKNNIWQVPAHIPNSQKYGFTEALLSGGGTRILFCSKYPRRQNDKSADLNLWIMERKENSWQNPVRFNSNINTHLHEGYATMANSGNLYFFREYKDKRGCEILVSSYQKGQWQKPIVMGPTINTNKHECDPFIDPEEDYLIYCVRDREGGYGKNDLYISFNRGSTWSKSFNLGPGINSTEEEITPFVSTDGKYLFFASKRKCTYDIYWVDAKIIEKLKPKESD